MSDGQSHRTLGGSVAHWMNRLVRRFRDRRILKRCGCICYCPRCKDPLNDQAYLLANGDDGRVTYKCRPCGLVSEWHFGIAPVPVCLSPNKALSDAQRSD